ncbi:MAG: hypothetical protein Q8O67_10165 [Deltaproteobacteria bacterium]|nr:hypothetical protein [Deltaproteobacteria bacterium]
MLPFLQQRGFVGDAYASGKQALDAIRRAPCHVLCIELELGDMMGVDLARTGKQEGIVGATLLLEDPIKSGMVISALARGIEAFVPVPPDEAMLMERLEALLLAQWGLAVTAQQQQLTDEIARLRAGLQTAEASASDAEERLADLTRSSTRELADERRKLKELIGEIASLRDQLATMHLLTGAKSAKSAEGAPSTSDEGNNVDDDFTGDFENERTQAIPVSMAREILKQEHANSMQSRTPNIDDFDFENEETPAGGAPQVSAVDSFANNDEDTAPGGHQVPTPSQLAEAKKPVKKKGASTANLDIEMLKDLARIPTAGEEEVIFVEDD